MKKLLICLIITSTLLLISCGDNEQTSGGRGNPSATEKSVVETSEIFEKNSSNIEQNEQSIATDTTDTATQGGEVNLPKVEF